MTDESILEGLRQAAGQESAVLANEPMSSHTTFKVGGPARFYVAPVYERVAQVFDWLEEMKRQEGLKYYVIGKGSNLLVRDEGYDGVIVDLSRNLKAITFDGCTVTAQAGAGLILLAAEAGKRGLTGLEFASGIPGSVGGAVAMNAGAYGGEIRNVITGAHVLSFPEKTGENVKILELTGEELELGYRHSRILSRHEIVLDATMKLAEGDPAAIRATMDDLLARRSEKQPLEYPSAGSTFKRPEGYFAGKLIMDAGLSGYRVGGAMVSPKHCGFVINYDGATASDILKLIGDVQEKVWERFGVNLEMEIQIPGE